MTGIFFLLFLFCLFFEVNSISASVFKRKTEKTQMLKQRGGENDQQVLQINKWFARQQIL